MKYRYFRPVSALTGILIAQLKYLVFMSHRQTAPALARGVGDDKAIAGGQLADVGAAAKGLQRDDINAPAHLCPAAAKLPGLNAEELADPCAPLVGQGLSVDQDQRRRRVRSDQRAGSAGIASAASVRDHAVTSILTRC